MRGSVTALHHTLSKRLYSGCYGESVKRAEEPARGFQKELGNDPALRITFSGSVEPALSGQVVVCAGPTEQRVTNAKSCKASLFISTFIRLSNKTATTFY